MGTNLLLIPLKFSVGIHLWYLYVLMGLYLFLPVISPWVEKAGKAAFAYFLLLWALTLLFPYLQTIFPSYLGKCPWNEYGPCIPSPGTWVTWCSAASEEIPWECLLRPHGLLGRSVSGRGFLVYPPFLPDVHGSGLVLKRRLHRLRQH